MKKTLSLLLVIVSMFAFSACSNQTEQQRAEYETIEITKDNYLEYMVINHYFSDVVLNYIETDSLNNRWYNLTCIGNIVTSAKIKNTYFENLYINFNIVILGWDTYTPAPSVNIDYKGDSLSSFSATKLDTIYLGFPTSHRFSIKANAVGGKVFVPKVI